MLIEGPGSVPRTNGSGFIRNTAANCAVKINLQRLAHSHVMNVLDMGGEGGGGSFLNLEGGGEQVFGVVEEGGFFGSG